MRGSKTFRRGGSIQHDSPTAKSPGPRRRALRRAKPKQKGLNTMAGPIRHSPAKAPKPAPSRARKVAKPSDAGSRIAASDRLRQDNPSASELLALMSRAVDEDYKREGERVFRLAEKTFGLSGKLVRKK